MKKMLLSALVGLCSTAALADHHHAISLEGVKYKAETEVFDAPVKETFDGFALGYSNSGTPIIGWGVKAEYIDADYVDLTSIVAFIHKDLWSNKHFYTNASLGVGVSYLKIDDLEISSGQVVFPINLETGVNVAKNIAVYGTVGYRFDKGLDDATVIYRGFPIKVDALDLEGVNYKFGVKYKF